MAPNPEQIEEAISEIQDAKKFAEEAEEQATNAQGAIDCALRALLETAEPGEWDALHGGWRVEDGTLVHDADTGNAFIFYKPNSPMYAYTLEADVLFEHEEGGVGLCFDSIDASDTERFRTGYWSGKRWGFHLSGRVDTPNLHAPELSEGVWHPIRIEVGLTAFSVDGGVTTHPRSFARFDNKVGLWCMGPGLKRFRNIRIDGVPILLPNGVEQVSDGGGVPPVVVDEPTPPRVDLPIDETEEDDPETPTLAVPDSWSQYFDDSYRVPPGTLQLAPGTEYALNPVVTRDPYAAMVRGQSSVELVQGDRLVVFQPWNTPGSTHYDRFGFRVASEWGKGWYRRAEVYHCELGDAESGIRPDIFGLSHDVYPEPNFSNLPSLPIPGGRFGSPDAVSPQRFVELFSEPWTGFWAHDYLARMYHPTENQPGYHREIYTVLGDAMCLVMCDFPGREALARRLCQIGIDMYGSTLSAKIQNESEPGWHSMDRSVHLGPIILAGYLLGDPEMLNCRYGAIRTQRQVKEDTHWQGHTVIWLQDSNRAYENRHPSTWTAADCKSDAYRMINSRSWAAIKASLSMIGQSLGEAFDVYVSRWMSEPGFAHEVVEAYNRNGRGLGAIAPGATASEFQRACWDAWMT